MPLFPTLLGKDFGGHHPPLPAPKMQSLRMVVLLSLVALVAIYKVT